MSGITDWPAANLASHELLIDNLASEALAQVDHPAQAAAHLVAAAADILLRHLPPGDAIGALDKMLRSTFAGLTESMK